MINYTLITKPGIILGNLVTVAAGFLLASKGHFDISLFLSVLLGLAFIIASACVFNNYIDRDIDRKMERTKQRALAAGIISGRNAIIFGIILLFIGSAILLEWTNPLTFYISISGFAIYVFLYSLWKPHTLYATAIGSLAGAVPPLAGYAAASNHLDIGAFLLFFMLVFWQMAHFHAIAIYRLKDYAKANIPVLPAAKGMLRTKIHILLFIIAFIPTALLLTYFGYTGKIYLTTTLLLGLFWIAFSIKGFWSKTDEIWGKQMFWISLVMINVIAFLIPLNNSL